MFVAGSNCIFTDDYLLQLRPKKPIEQVSLSHMCKLKRYIDFNINDFYIVGVDSARSLTGDYCGIEVFQYSNFEQVGEFISRIGSLTKFADVVKDVIDYIYSKVGKRIIVGIENNSIGMAIVESLQNENKFDYLQFLYQEDPKKPGAALKPYGINTNVKTKDKMVSVCYDYLNEDPSILHSGELISQLSVIEKTSTGSVAAQRGQHDDLFMATCFCALVKKERQFDIEPLINTNSTKYYQQQEELIQNIISIDHKNIEIDVSKYFPDAEISTFNYNYNREKPKQVEQDLDFSDIPFPEFF